MPTGPDSARRGDTDLVAACLAHDATAWDALVDRYASLVYAIPLRAGLSAEDAADVFQSVWVILLDKLRTLRDAQSLPAWLITTTKRETWSMLRRQRAAVRVAVTDVAEARVPYDAVEDPAPSPEASWLAFERRLVLRSAVNQLASPCRELITALFGEDKPPSYIALAARLGMPANSLGPTRTRCLGHLRRLLDDNGFFA